MIECFNPLVVLVKIGSYQLGKSTIINKIQSFYSRNATLHFDTTLLSGFNCNNYDFAKYTQVRKNTHKFAKIHTSLRKCTQVCENAHKFAKIHTSSRKCTQVCKNAHKFAKIHTSLRKYTQVCENTHKFAKMHTSLRKCTQVCENTLKFIF